MEYLIYFKSADPPNVLLVNDEKSINLNNLFKN